MSSEWFGDIDEALELVVIGGEKFEVIHEQKMQDNSSVDLVAYTCSSQQQSKQR